MYIFWDLHLHLQNMNVYIFKIHLHTCKFFWHVNVNHNAILFWGYCTTIVLGDLICKKWEYCTSYCSSILVGFLNKNIRPSRKQDDKGELTWNKSLMKLATITRITRWPWCHHKWKGITWGSYLKHVIVGAFDNAKNYKILTTTSITLVNNF